MNFNQLEWFVVACETGSFAKASEGSYVSRQALGKAIRALESELGATLFVRTELGVEPTQTAREMLPFVRECLKARDALTAVCVSQDGMRPVVRVAIADGVVESLPPDFFDRLEDAAPAVELRIERHFYTRCVKLLAESEVTFALVPGPQVGQGFVHRPLVSEELYVAVSPQLAVLDDACTLEDLALLPFLVVGEEPFADLGLASLLASHGLEVREDGRYTDYDIILRRARAGLGAVIAPRSMLDRVRGNDLQVVPFPSSELCWQVDFLLPARSLTAPERQVVAFVDAFAAG